MKRIRVFFNKTRYVLVFLLVGLVSFSFFSILRKTGRIEEIFIGKGAFTWTKGKRLYVTNHPSWIDQFIVIALRVPFWSTNFLPFVLVADDNVKRLSFLSFLRKTAFIVPIVRNGNKFAAKSQIREMEALLDDNQSLMMAGSPGRDFKGSPEEKIYSSIEGKPLRKFTNLCGRFAVIPGVETIPLCIKGTDKLYYEIEVNGEKDMKFSWSKFFIDFILIGKIKVKIIYAEPLHLGGNHKEAAQKVQTTVLSFLDY
ncbi:MAG: hypothetical protein ABID67_01460 [Candidatus Nealsonbacteria bacterium]